MKKIENSLVEALNWASLRELPPKDNGEDVYILSLAKVLKIDGSKSYVAMSKDEKGNNRIVKDFGSLAKIVKIEEVYPYLLLNSNYVPQFKSNKKEERIAWLSTYDVNKDWSSMSLKELNKEILSIAMKNQIKSQFKK